MTDSSNAQQNIPTRSVARNTVLLFGLQVFARLLNFFATILLANYLGSEHFGVYNYALALATLFVPLSDLGMDMFLMRESPRSTREQTARLFGSVLVSKGGISFLVLLFLTLVASSLETVGSDRFVNILLAGGVVLLRVYWNTFSSVLRGIDRVKDETWLFSLARVAEFAGIMTAVYLKADLTAVLVAMLAMNLLAVGMTVAIVRSRFVPITIDRDRSAVLRAIRGGLPFALAGLFSSIYFNFDTVLLAKMIGDETAGVYRAAYYLVLPLMMVSGALASAAFPFLSQQYRSQPELVGRVFQKGIRLLTMFSVPTAVITTFLAGDIIGFLYSPEYAEAATSLAILIWFLPLASYTNFFGHSLGAMDDQPFVLRVNTVNLVFNVVTNLIFIPLFAQLAAAIITVVTELIGFLFLSRRIRSRIHASSQVVTLVRMAVAGALIVPYLVFRPDVHVLLNIPIALLLYGIGLVIVRAVSWKELRDLVLLRMLRQPPDPT